MERTQNDLKGYVVEPCIQIKNNYSKYIVSISAFYFLIQLHGKIWCTSQPLFIVLSGFECMHIFNFLIST